LFNPSKNAPSKLIDSGFVVAYTNSAYRYSFFRPTSWDVRSTDQAGKQVTVSTAADEYITVDTQDAPAITDLGTWLSQNVTAFNAITSTPLLSAKWTGFLNQDGTEAYLVQKSAAPSTLLPYVYHVKYVAGVKNEISFRTTFNMLITSMIEVQ